MKDKIIKPLNNHNHNISYDVFTPRIFSERQLVQVELTKFDNEIFGIPIISTQEEMFSFEKLYSIPRMTFKRINTTLKNTTPSVVWHEKLRNNSSLEILDKKVNDFLIPIYQKRDFIISFNNNVQFPNEAINSYMDYPIPLLYCKGNADLLDNTFKVAPYISIVGTRNISENGYRRTQKLIRELKKYSDNITIISGLAKGVDTVALKTAIELNLQVIALIGTPIDQYYPTENIDLQNTIARKHLLVSHVPFYRYNTEPFQSKKYHFPERNSIMAAISDATIIIEASETSGTRTQAKDCLKHRKPLFFLKSCYDSGKKWIYDAVDSGAHILDDVGQIWDILGNIAKI